MIPLISPDERVRVVQSKCICADHACVGATIVKRFSLGSLMLLVVTIALWAALMIRTRQAARRELVLKAELVATNHELVVAEESRRNVEAYLKQVKSTKGNAAAK